MQASNTHSDFHMEKTGYWFKVIEPFHLVTFFMEQNYSIALKQSV